MAIPRELDPGHVIALTRGTRVVRVFTSTSLMAEWLRAQGPGASMFYRRTDVPVDVPERGSPGPLGT